MTENVTSEAGTTAAIERTLELDASPARVWRALTDPRELAAWFPDRVDDLVPGEEGEGWLFWKDHGRYAIRLELVESPSRLVWRWARDAETSLDAGPTTTVEWRLEPLEGGGTKLHLRESGFARPEDRAGNVAGWEHELGELVAHLGS